MILSDQPSHSYRVPPMSPIHDSNVPNHGKVCVLFSIVASFCFSLSKARILDNMTEHLPTAHRELANLGCLLRSANTNICCFTRQSSASLTALSSNGETSSILFRKAVHVNRVDQSPSAVLFHGQSGKDPTPVVYPFKLSSLPLHARCLHLCLKLSGLCGGRI